MEEQRDAILATLESLSTIQRGGGHHCPRLGGRVREMHPEAAENSAFRTPCESAGVTPRFPL